MELSRGNKEKIIMEKYYTNVRIEGGKSEINEILSLMAKIQYLGNSGATATIPVVVDGDGSGQVSFYTTDTESNLVEEFKLEEFKKQVDSGAGETEAHWIGE